MMHNALIIMPFYLPWDWSADYQRQTCFELSKHNMVIVYLHNDARFFLKSRPETTHKKIKNIFYYQPRYILPFRRFRFIEQLNQLLCLWYLVVRYGANKSQKIVWIFDPIFWFYPMLKKFYMHMITLYDCVDYMWSRDNESKKRTQQMERELTKRVDYFFVNSHVLYDLHKAQRIPNAIVPQGFRLDEFKKYKKTQQKKFPHDKPILGYVGAINHRLNFDLLYNLMRKHPNWILVLWGKIQETEDEDLESTTRHMKTLLTLPNVLTGYSKYPRETAGVIKEFNVALIPYHVKYLGVRYSYPMKLFEYFYMGKPVVSTDVVELRRFPKFVFTAKNLFDTEESIRHLIRVHWIPHNKGLQKRLAISNSWSTKMQAILKYLQKEPATL